MNSFRIVNNTAWLLDRQQESLNYFLIFIDKNFEKEKKKSI